MQRAGGGMVRNFLEMLPFIIGILSISIVAIWLAWAVFGFLAADVPVVVKVVRP
jgi:hypothetical protein